MLSLTCPGCGFSSSLEVFAGDVDARHVAALMGQVPPQLADLVLRYLALFAPLKHKVPLSRARRHLEPLVELIKAGKVRVSYSEHPAPIAIWEAALTQMLERRADLTLPLKSHGYLLKIVAGEADKIEAAAERATEDQRRGITPARTPATETDADRAQRIERQARQELASVAAARTRLKQPALTPDEEAAVLDSARRRVA